MIYLFVLLFGICIGCIWHAYISDNKQKKLFDDMEKYRVYYDILLRWDRIKNKGAKIESFFEEYGYRTIAVYGINQVGKRLIDDLMESSVTISFGIDRRKIDDYSGVRVIRPENVIQRVDAWVVIPLLYFDIIKKSYGEKAGCPIISLEDVISYIESITY